MAIFCACGHFAIWPIYQADPPDHVTGPHGSMKRRTVSDPHPPSPPPFIGPTFFLGGGGQTLQIIFVMLLMYFHWNLAIQLLVILFVRAIHLKGKK